MDVIHTDAPVAEEDFCSLTLSVVRQPCRHSCDIVEQAFNYAWMQAGLSLDANLTWTLLHTTSKSFSSAHAQKQLTVLADQLFRVSSIV